MEGFKTPFIIKVKKSMNIEVFKFYLHKALFPEGTTELNWFIRKFAGSSKRIAVCDVSILNSLF